MLIKNVFLDLPGKDQAEEFFEEFVRCGAVKIERIVSDGHTSPENFWFDQEQNEWVIVLRGEAKLLFEGDIEAVDLKSGDWINIPAHVKHRVVWTVPGEKTIWLAVHY